MKIHYRIHTSTQLYKSYTFAVQNRSLINRTNWIRIRSTQKTKYLRDHRVRFVLYFYAGCWFYPQSIAGHWFMVTMDCWRQNNKNLNKSAAPPQFCGRFKQYIRICKYCPKTVHIAGVNIFVHSKQKTTTELTLRKQWYALYLKKMFWAICRLRKSLLKFVLVHCPQGTICEYLMHFGVFFFPEAGVN